MPDNRNSGQDPPRWERLFSALTRVTSGAITEGDAKRSICDAIADRAIAIRLALRKHTTKGMTAHGRVFGGADVEIPAHLEPEDIDFENSRPLEPWYIAREKNRYLAGRWDVDWIELSSADVTKELIPASDGEQPPAANEPRERSRPRPKAQPARDRALDAIKVLYPDGVPQQATEPNKNLCQRVAAWLKESGVPDVSDDTILRAAGRR
jgi:hypothetical protein